MSDRSTWFWDGGGGVGARCVGGWVVDEELGECCMEGGDGGLEVGLW